MTALPLDLLEDKDRLTELYKHGILDSKPEKKYDDLVALLAKTCEVPLAYLSLIDKDRQWFKTVYGGDFGEVDLKDSFCTYTIQGKGTLVIPDASLDERFRDNPFVAAPDGIRYYAGHPLISSEGHVLGTLCIVDFRPREMGESQMLAIKVLSGMVIRELEAQFREKQVVNYAKELEGNRRVIEDQHQQLSAAMQQVQEINEKLNISNESLEDAMKSRTAELEMFLYRASHDLARPISSMLGLGMLGVMKTEDPELENMFGQVQHLAKGMQTLLDNQLLIYEFKDYVPVPETLNLKVLVGRAQLTASSKFPKAKWNVQFHSVSQEVFSSDANLWTIILVSLLENAWVFRKDPESIPTVSIRLKRDEGEGILSVKDDGQGIHPDAGDRIFEMFYRGSTASDGNGLGLYLAQKAAELVGGEITYECINRGETTFFVRFPWSA
ncbi:MAG TPA: hypothetical protein DCE41_12965 [Cytophagales bacterium]|nr:hypothetical protein [Cytophagales bacterium]HAA23805.1 hypothetical protein [Cytophagales bacterium]HAP63021.1 hypothetical protein [Cytophagales bacterium]